MKITPYFWRKGFWAFLSILFAFTIGLIFFYLYLVLQLPDVESLKTVKLQVPLRIYTQEGMLIQEYGEKRRIPVQYNDIPPILIKSILATEDQRFFEHAGIDIFGLGRAAISMIKTGSKSQGGSTITMQVARNFFLTRKKTFLRKFNEILLAIKIDKELSKEKILELYLNKIYLGNRAYGVAAAAKVYFGKELHELDLSELAVIAGLPQAPSSQNPIANPVAAKKRRDHVLERLLEEKYINEQDFQQAVNKPITASYHGTNIEVSAPWVAEMIRQSLYEHFGADAYTNGYKVYTTIKGSYQLAANAAIKKHLLEYDQKHGFRGPITTINLIDNLNPKTILNSYPSYYDLEPALVLEVKNQEVIATNKSGAAIIIPWKGLAWARKALKHGWVGNAPTSANKIVSPGNIIYVRNVNNQWQLSQVPEVEAALVALNPNNGAINALVGGFDFEKSKFNRATQSERQPGSSFKPFIYAAALNKGYNLATLVNDAPIVVEDPSQDELWRPHNSNLTFNGPTRLKEALIHSRNMVSIRILDDIGFDYATDYVSQFGFNKEHLPKALSLALGSLSVNPLQLSAAYAVLANGGYKVEPYLIDRVTDNEGEILLQSKPTVVNTDEKNDTHTIHAPRAINSDTAYLIYNALKEVVQQGTGKAASLLNREDLAGKTGTTNDQNDAWFAGFNQDIIATVWMGYDSLQSLHEYAASLAVPLWVDFMRPILTNLPVKELKQPENVISLRIDPITGLFADSSQANSIIEYFSTSSLPANNN